VTWVKTDGKEMTDVDWRDAKAQTLGMLIDGAATDEVDERGHAVCGDTLLLIMNSGESAQSFVLPPLGGKNMWVIMVDTAREDMPVVKKSKVSLEAHSLMLLRHGSDRRQGTPDEPRREPLTAVEKHTL
jgi:glycogen operon protein